jgi:hypothetical protein
MNAYEEIYQIKGKGVSTHTAPGGEFQILCG